MEVVRTHTGIAMSEPIRRRRRLQPNETDFLIRIFEQYPRPNSAMRELLAQKLGMSPRGIQIWFQNRRAKVKRDLIESGKAMLLFAPTYPLLDHQVSDESPDGSPTLMDEFLEETLLSTKPLDDLNVPSAEQLEKLMQEMIDLPTSALPESEFLNL